VCQGIWLHDGQREAVAIKYLKRADEESKREFMKEADRIMGFNHRYIVGVKGLVEHGEVALVLELLPLGALNKYLKTKVNTLSPQLLTTYISQIAEGMEYLEEMKVLHRDLAARNILVKAADCVQISDFGLSRLTGSDSKDYYTAQSKGKWPIKWYALECIYYRKFTHKSDVWSFGVTSWEVFNYGKKPYGKLKGQQVVLLLEEGVRLPRPENCTLDLYALLMRCWSLEARRRPTFTEIRQELRALSGGGGGGPRTNSNAMARIKVTMDNQKLYDTLPDPQELAVVEDESRRHIVASLSVKKLKQEQASYIKFDALAYLPDSFEGSFGPVKSGKLKIGGGHSARPVAIKAIVALETFNATRFQREFEELRTVSSPYVVKLYGLSEHPNKSVLIVQEYMKLGPLNLYLKRARVDKNQKARFGTQIALGMKHLESMRPPIVHRDLAARNVLVQSNFSCKVGDVGMSRALCLGPGYYRSKQKKSTPMKWYAPEAIHSNTFTTKSDAWAWGVTFWEIMASGATPYGEQTGTQVLQLLERGQRLAIPTEFSVGQLAPCRGLLEKVWLPDPRARPSFAEIYATMHRVVPETTEGM
jgi:serine/threonine protein kinase